MATELQVFDHTFLTGADLSAQQFHIVKLGVNPREVVLATALADQQLGVLQDKPDHTVNRAATVRIIGISKVVAGAAIPVHSLVGADGQGRAIVAATGHAIGLSIEVAGAAGDIITVLVIPGLM